MSHSTSPHPLVPDNLVEIHGPGHGRGWLEVGSRCHNFPLEYSQSRQVDAFLSVVK